MSVEPIPVEDEVLDDAAPPVEVVGLCSRYGEQVIHDGLDLKVKRGEVLGMVGGSDSGKSVLLNTLIGLKRPDGGTIKLFGVDLSSASEAEWSAIERRWGVLFQQGALFSNLTVRENVSAPMFEHTRLDKQEVRRLAGETLPAGYGFEWSGASYQEVEAGNQAPIVLAFGLVVVFLVLPEAATKKPSELSGGMRKRAGLARALALDPELLFLDEPTSGLDPIGAAEFDELIADLSDSLGLTVFMITHDMDSLYAICDRVAVLADKKIVAVAPVGELERSDHPWIKEYFLGPRGRAANKNEGGPGMIGRRNKRTGGAA